MLNADLKQYLHNALENQFLVERFVFIISII